MREHDKVISFLRLLLFGESDYAEGLGKTILHDAGGVAIYGADALLPDFCKRVHG
jgi:hypothetical protein